MATERLILLLQFLILNIGMMFYTSITQLLKVAGLFKYGRSSVPSGIRGQIMLFLK